MRNLSEIADSPAGTGERPARIAYRVGDVEVDSTGYIRRAGDGDVYLRQQTLQVLLYLLAHRDRMVGKEELRRTIWGDTAVTDDALVQCVVDIRRALGDDSRAQRLIKTVPRIGYRFVGPVEVIDVQNEDEATAGARALGSGSPGSQGTGPGQPPWWTRGRLILLAASVLVAIAALSAV